MRKLYIFDMDGTLTPPRQQIEESTQHSLINLLEDKKAENHVAIVTGSDLNYMVEQCSSLFEYIHSLNTEVKERLTLFPCNGTKKYTFSEDSTSYKLIEELDIKKFIGNESYTYLVRLIMQIQLRAISMQGLIGNIPITGNFISYRKSMLNWCPIGRDCPLELREIFINFDNVNHIREQLVYELEHCLYLSDLDDKIMIALGGQTSIDIYPYGWDKTKALKSYNLSSFEKIYFFGDKCNKGENDFTIFTSVNFLNHGLSHSVSNPRHTEKLLELIDLL
jgi:phosphomannomutase